MPALTMFTWGYDGWGSSTCELKQAVDAVERERGYAPPYFVDIRLRRNVRAAGFRDSAFENLLGQSRYRWMRSLGNRGILNKGGPRLQISQPGAAEELLDLALTQNDRGAR